MKPCVTTTSGTPCENGSAFSWYKMLARFSTNRHTRLVRTNTRYVYEQTHGGPRTNKHILIPEHPINNIKRDALYKLYRTSGLMHLISRRFSARVSARVRARGIRHITWGETESTWDETEITWGQTQRTWGQTRRTWGDRDHVGPG